MFTSIDCMFKRDAAILCYRVFWWIKDFQYTKKSNNILTLCSRRSVLERAVLHCAPFSLLMERHNIHGEIFTHHSISLKNVWLGRQLVVITDCICLFALLSGALSGPVCKQHKMAIEVRQRLSPKVFCTTIVLPADFQQLQSSTIKIRHQHKAAFPHKRFCTGGRLGAFFAFG